MNRDLLLALSLIASEFYHDALKQYPELLFARDRIPGEEAMVVWRILIALDELWLPLQAANDFRPRPTPLPVDDDLPF